MECHYAANQMALEETDMISQHVIRQIFNKLHDK